MSGELRFGVVSESVPPTVFVGSAAQIREDLRARRDRFGLSYLVAGDGAVPVLTEIISGL